jgi:hypothetical protein
MTSTGWVIGLLVVVGQVPRPSSGEEVARELEAARRSILAHEAADLRDLAGRLARSGEAQAATEVGRYVPRPAAPDGPTRIMPLADVVRPAERNGPAGGWRGPFQEIRSRSASELFALAERAARAQPARFGLAMACLGAVIERHPDHREARRLLGYVPHEGGWATPYAIRQLREGKVSHPVFGWVPSDWVGHLEGGELPAPPVRNLKRVRWMPARDVDRLRADWRNRWDIGTEHFEILTNVPLAEAASFGHRLEAFYDLFVALMADVLGENLALSRRWRDTSQASESPLYKRHLVYYFGTKEEYVEYLTPGQGLQIAETLGFYDTAKSGRGRRIPACFFRDPDGRIPATATLYHEVSHQLLFEMAGPSAYTKNLGNFWVFEGLGTYFETVEPQPDGSLEVGGPVGARMEEALRALVDHNLGTPLAQFVDLSPNAFTHRDRIRLNYQQAMALTIFLMQWHEGTYRDGFLDYLRDAYRGRLRGNTGRSLQDRLGQPYTTLEAQFRAFLEAARAEGQGRPPAEAKPASGGGIRTVPSR